MRQIFLISCAMVLMISASSAPAHSKPPTVTSLFPGGVRQGTTTLLKASGTFDAWPARAWVSGSGVQAIAASEKGAFWFTVSRDAAVGLRWVRFWDDSGASPLRPILVGTLPEIAEIEPNDNPKNPHLLIQDAVTVNGKLARNGDVDGFGVRLRRGQTLVAAVEANRRLGSPMDGVIQIVGPEGFVAAHNDDDHDRDPLLVYEAPADGLYVVRVFAFPTTPDSRIGFSGGSNHVYRLTVTTRGYMDHAFPLAISAEGTTDVSAEGWNLSDGESALTVSGAKTGGPEIPLQAPGQGGEGEVLRVEHAAIVEAEPNAPEQPQLVTPPVTVSGRIDPDDDQDAYRFPVKKGVKARVFVEAQALGFALDPVIRISDASGKVVREMDDPGGRRSQGRDPDATVTPEADGELTVTVKDLNGHGGPRQLYRLTVEPVRPELELSAEADRLTLAAGKPGKLKVTLDRRDGFEDSVEVVAVGLPEGITAAPVTSEAKGDSAKAVTLTFEAKPGAASGPFRVEGRPAKSPGSPKMARAKVDGFGGTADLWLTAPPK